MEEDHKIIKIRSQEVKKAFYLTKLLQQCKMFESEVIVKEKLENVDLFNNNYFTMYILIGKIIMICRL